MSFEQEVSTKIGQLDERTVQIQKKLDEHCEAQTKFMQEMTEKLSPVYSLPKRVEALEAENQDQKVGRAKAAGILIGLTTAGGAIGSQIQDFLSGVVK